MNDLDESLMDALSFSWYAMKSSYSKFLGVASTLLSLRYAL